MFFLLVYIIKNTFYGKFKHSFFFLKKLCKQSFKYDIWNNDRKSFKTIPDNNVTYHFSLFASMSLRRKFLEKMTWEFSRFITFLIIHLVVFIQISRHMNLSLSSPHHCTFFTSKFSFFLCFPFTYNLCLF